MLYVSSFHQNRNVVGITDTDDGVEQLILSANLVELVRQRKLRVLGVVGDSVSVAPYSDKTAMRRLFTKYELLGFEFDGTYTRLVAYRGNTERITVPPVSVIGSECFSNKILGEVFVPPTVQAIDSNAFKNSTMGKLHLSEGLTYICDYAFDSANFVSDLLLPDSLKEIKQAAFTDSKTETGATIHFGTGLTHISSHAFHYCAALCDVRLPSIEYIGTFAFNNSRIQMLQVGSSLKNIPQNMCFGCKSLRIVKLGRVEHIDSGAFLGCDALYSATVPRSCKCIRNGAFSVKLSQYQHPPAWDMYTLKVRNKWCELLPGCADYRKVVYV